MKQTKTKQPRIKKQNSSPNQPDLAILMNQLSENFQISSSQQSKSNKNEIISRPEALEKLDQLMSNETEQYENDNQWEENILAKAKRLVEDKKEHIEKIKYKQKIPKANTFLTGINIVQEEPEKMEIPSDYYEQDNGVDDGDVLANLNNDYPQDDLSDLWQLIHKTDKKINNYGKNLKVLHKNVESLNQGFRQEGKGVNDLVFLKMDKDFRKAEKKKNKYQQQYI